MVQIRDGAQVVQRCATNCINAVRLKRTAVSLSSSDRYEVTQSRVADIKLKLIKRLLKIVAILTTIALAMYPLSGLAFGSEKQVLTYSPDVLRFDTAGTTQSMAVEVMTATTSTPVVEKTIEEKILEEFRDDPIMLEVARCESELNPLADRANLNVDVGLFQINQVHLGQLNKLGLDRRDADDNIKYARILYNQSGLKPWENSRYCWSRYS